MGETYVYTYIAGSCVLIQYRVTASLYPHKLHQPFPQLRQLYARPCIYIYIYIRRPAGPDIVLLVKFRTDLERLSRIFDGHLYLVQRERGKKENTDVSRGI